MLGQGTGSEIRQPLGYAMVGGVLVHRFRETHHMGRIHIFRRGF
jgi:hypothetical protein